MFVGFASLVFFYAVWMVYVKKPRFLLKRGFLVLVSLSVVFVAHG